VILFGSIVYTNHGSIPFLSKCCFGLKQVTPKGCNACEVCEGKVTIFKSKSCAYYIDVLFSLAKEVQDWALKNVESINNTQFYLKFSL
jgi:hypothetical protein